MNELKFSRKQKSDEAFPSEIYQIRADSIRPNRAQPRATFDNNAIIRLADSIRRYGILQPLTVRPAEDDDLYSYELIAGERRLRAAKMLGYLTVPCVILSVDESTSAEMAIIENLLREDLNMFEQAYGFKKLIENHSLTQDEVARRMSLSQSAVANKLRLLKLTFEEQKLILETSLTERHARALLRIDEQELRAETIRHIAINKLNVRQTEEYIDCLIFNKANVLSKTEEEKVEKRQELQKANNEADILLQKLQQHIDKLKKQGKRASVNIVQNAHTVDITIRIAK
jgi:ParB family chromosome partitioning protein